MNVIKKRILSNIIDASRHDGYVDGFIAQITMAIQILSRWNLVQILKWVDPLPAVRLQTDRD